MKPSRRRTSDTSELPDLADALGPLWPDMSEPAVRRGLWPAEADSAWSSELLLFPSKRRPRLLLPTESTLASRTFQMGRPATSRTQALMNAFITRALSMGAARAWPSRMLSRRHGTSADETIEGFLTTVFAQPVAVAVALGPRRANRKPVLLVVDREGTSLGVVKIGTTALTGRLVAAEATNLVELSGLSWDHLVIPRCITSTTWNGLQVLVQTALPTWRGSARPSRQLRLRAMQEVARCRGSSRLPLSNSRYVHRLTDRLKQVRDPQVAALGTQVLGAIDANGRGDVIEFGAWHGDWSAWNMALDGEQVLLWDWERFEDDVPVGFDELHYCFRALRQASRSASEPGVALLTKAPDLLGDFGVAGSQSPSIAALYLLEMGTRFLSDREQVTGLDTAPVKQWMVPALQSFLRCSGERREAVVGDLL